MDRDNKGQMDEGFPETYRNSLFSVDCLVGQERHSLRINRSAALQFTKLLGQNTRTHICLEAHAGPGQSLYLPLYSMVRLVLLSQAGQKLGYFGTRLTGDGRPTGEHFQ